MGPAPQEVEGKSAGISSGPENVDMVPGAVMSTPDMLKGLHLTHLAIL